MASIKLNWSLRQVSLPNSEWLESTFPELSAFKPLGQGGQKTVYEVVHRVSGAVVLKIIHPRTNVQSVEREILAVQQVQSSRVPKILAHGLCASNLGDCIWFLEQLIIGQPVREVLAAGPLDAHSVLRLGLHVLEALERTESAQIVHRDVKPDNIMLDKDGAFWLLDYGIARHLELPSLTATGLPFGKMMLGYAPPEQCRNMKTEIDSRADLFALGVTLHECATGKNGFFDPPPRDQLDILRRVERWVLPPVTLAISEHKSFQDLLQSLTQKSRVHRPRNIQSALAWLREICAKEGVK